MQPPQVGLDVHLPFCSGQNLLVLKQTSLCPQKGIGFCHKIEGASVLLLLR